MTRLDIFIKIFSDFSGKSEDDLTHWAETNLSDDVREYLGQSLTDEETEALLQEYKKDPVEVMRFISSFLTAQGTAH